MPHRHLVQFYNADAELLTTNVSQFLSEGLLRGESVIVIATPEHRADFIRTLESNGLQIASMQAEGRAVFADAGDTLSRFMVDGWPDRDRFESVIRSLTFSFGVGSKARAYGEMVGLLWSAGQIAAAVRLEELWNQLLESTGFTLFCGYPVDIFSSDFDIDGIDAVLSTHTHLVPTGRDGALGGAIDRALKEVFGTKLEGLRLLMKSNLSPGWGVIPNPEAVILWLRRNLPGSANDVLTRARRYYDAVPVA